MDFVNQLIGFRPVMDQPVGKGIAYAAGFGLSRALGRLVASFGVKQAYLVPIIVAMLAKLDYAKRYLGEEITEIVATSSWIGAVDSALNISGQVEGLLSMVLGQQTLTERSAAAAVEAKAVAGQALTSAGQSVLGMLGFSGSRRASLGATAGGGYTALERKLAAIR